MSVRSGAPFELTAAAAATGASHHGILTNGGGWTTLIGLMAIWVASATVGNRILSLRIKDSAGNIMWQSLQGTAVTAGQTVNIVSGGGAAPAAVTGPPITQTISLPVDFPIPPSGTIEIVDGAAIDAADTCSMAATLTA
jgi:hypothetical protein